MSTLYAPAAKHPFHAFLSYSHADRPLVDSVYRWLVGAGLRIYQDVVYGEAGEPLHVRLGDRINASWSLLLFFSENSAKSRWVEDEWTYGLERERELAGFRVLPVRIGDAELPHFLRTRKCVDMPDGRLTLSSAIAMLDGICGSNDGADSAVGRDIYVARSWRPGEMESGYADEVCSRLRAADFRLIGDAQGHFDGYDPQRLSQLIESCAGFVAILPHRGGGKTSAEMLDEVGIARRLRRPALLIADDNVTERPAWPGHEWLCASTLSPLLPERNDTLASAIEALHAEVLRASRNACFYLAPGDHFDSQFGEQHFAVPKLLERITRIPCVLARTNSGRPFRQHALPHLTSAVGVVADLTSEREIGFVNVGAALGANRPVHVSVGARPPAENLTGLLGIPETREYTTPEELLGIVVQAATRYRRQVYDDLRPRSS